MTGIMGKTAEVYVAERWDELEDGLGVWQDPDGYRFGTDSVLLARFARVHSGARVLDMGCGDGVIALLLSAHTRSREIVGVEIREDAARRAQRSVARNGLQARVTIHHMDFEDGDMASLGQFDVVVCNPPYRTVTQGEVSPNASRRAARCELHTTLAGFMRAAAKRLAAKGRLYIIYPVDRMAALLGAMTAECIEPKRAAMVQPRRDAPPRWVMVEGLKNGAEGMRWEAPVVVAPQQSQ